MDNVGFAFGTLWKEATKAVEAIVSGIVAAGNRRAAMWELNNEQERARAQQNYDSFSGNGWFVFVIILIVMILITFVFYQTNGKTLKINVK